MRDRADSLGRTRGSPRVFLRAILTGVLVSSLIERPNWPNAAPASTSNRTTPTWPLLSAPHSAVSVRVLYVFVYGLPKQLSSWRSPRVRRSFL